MRSYFCSIWNIRQRGIFGGELLCTACWQHKTKIQPNTHISFINDNAPSFKDIILKRFRLSWYLRHTLQNNILYVQVTVHCDKFRIKQPTRCIKYPKFICHETLQVSGIFCAHHQELSTVRMPTGMFHAGYVTAS
jgi:hypothetical protein